LRLNFGVAQGNQENIATPIKSIINLGRKASVFSSGSRNTLMSSIKSEGRGLKAKGIVLKVFMNFYEIWKKLQLMFFISRIL
jgi:hypothetical protein